MLPLVQHYIDSLPDNLFFVLHTYGSHFNYFERYPREFAHFTPDEATEVEVKNRQQLINAYDNSIRYTDFVLAEIIKEIAALKEQAFALYFSDHGDDVGLEAESCHCHTTNPARQTEPMFEIPFLLWTNKAYGNANSSLISSLPQYIDRPFVNHNLIHSLPTLAGLSFDLQDDTKNLFSDKFIPEQP